MWLPSDFSDEGNHTTCGFRVIFPTEEKLYRGELEPHHQKILNPDIQACCKQNHGDGIQPGRILTLEELIVKAFFNVLLIHFPS